MQNAAPLLRRSCSIIFRASSSWGFVVVGLRRRGASSSWGFVVVGLRRRQLRRRGASSSSSSRAGAAHLPALLLRCKPVRTEPKPATIRPVAEGKNRSWAPVAAGNTASLSRRRSGEVRHAPTCSERNELRDLHLCCETTSAAWPLPNDTVLVQNWRYAAIRAARHPGVASVTKYGQR
jgi:hypothetical protein